MFMDVKGQQDLCSIEEIQRTIWSIIFGVKETIYFIVKYPSSICDTKLSTAEANRITR